VARTSHNDEERTKTKCLTCCGTIPLVKTFADPRRKPLLVCPHCGTTWAQIARRKTGKKILQNALGAETVTRPGHSDASSAENVYDATKTYGKGERHD